MFCVMVFPTLGSIPSHMGTENSSHTSLGAKKEKKVTGGKHDIPIQIQNLVALN